MLSLKENLISIATAQCYHLSVPTSNVSELPAWYIMSPWNVVVVLAFFDKCEIKTWKTSWLDTVFMMQNQGRLPVCI